jgi:uncharacterized protein Smg (DUF494 family)
MRAAPPIPPILLFGDVIPNESEGSVFHMTFRILGPHERGRFAPDAWGQLLSLSRTGAVTSNELEQLIERALIQIDGRIALDDLRALVEGAGLPAPVTEGRETVH